MNRENATHTLLIAEDDINSFKLLKAVLREFDCKIIHVNDGQRAVDACKNDKSICMVLMDIKMPGMDGVTATKRIKEMNPDIVVVAQTAYATTYDLEMYKDVFDAYLTKPLNLIELKATLTKYCKK